jgi:mRNA interferase RelE/StbE
MAAYEVYFRESVEKDFRNIPKKDLTRILHRVELLSIEPRPQGCEKLTGQEKYRLRQGRYRIIYSIEDEKLVVLIVKVAHRRDIYR